MLIDGYRLLTMNFDYFSTVIKSSTEKQKFNRNALERLTCVTLYSFAMPVVKKVCNAVEWRLYFYHETF